MYEYAFKYMLRYESYMSSWSCALSYSSCRRIVQRSEHCAHVDWSVCFTNRVRIFQNVFVYAARVVCVIFLYDLCSLLLVLV